MATRHESDDKEDEERPFVDTHSQTEITKKLYAMEKDALRCSSRIESRLVVVEKQLDNMSERIKELVTRMEFTPVKLLTYGFAAALLAGVVAALLAQVMHK